jgi:hypothetical protein
MNRYEPLVRVLFPSFLATMFLTLSVGAAAIPSGLPSGYTGKPFTGDTLKGHYQQIPGVIKSVFFDEGGEGVGFHEMDGNGVGGGGTMRPDAKDRSVEMQAFDAFWDWTVNQTAEPLGSWHMSWINCDTINGDWFRMSVHVNTAGTYSIDIHEACVYQPNAQAITFNDAPRILVTGLDSVKNSQIHAGSESWHIWNLFKNAAEVTLDTGLYTLKYQFLKGGYNFDKLIFTLKSTKVTQQAAYGKTIAEGPVGLNIVQSGDELNLSYNRFGSGEAKISLANCAGKTVLSSVENSMTAGRHSRTMSMQAMRSGVYFVQVEQNGRREVRQFTVTGK